MRISRSAWQRARTAQSVGNHFGPDLFQVPNYTLETAYVYKIRSDGTVQAWYVFRNASGGFPGIGSEALDLVLPYLAATGAVGDLQGAGMGMMLNGDGVSPGTSNLILVSVTGYVANFFYQTAVGLPNLGRTTFVDFDAQGGVQREMRGQFFYRTF